MIFIDAPPPPPTHIQNYGPEGANNHFQYSQCTGKKKALCVCFFVRTLINPQQQTFFLDRNQLFRSGRRVKRVYQRRKQYAKIPV